MIRIDIDQSFSKKEIFGIGEGVYQALLSIGVPKDDRFQIINTHSSDTLIFDRNYPGEMKRSDRFVLIQVFLNQGRPIELKKNLFSAIAKNLSEVGVRPEDIFVNLSEVPKENWSFGHGLAQYADK